MEKGNVVHHAATGMADVAQGRKMEKDAVLDRLDDEIGECHGGHAAGG